MTRLILGELEEAEEAVPEEIYKKTESFQRIILIAVALQCGI